MFCGNGNTLPTEFGGRTSVGNDTHFGPTCHFRPVFKGPTPSVGNRSEMTSKPTELSHFRPIFAVGNALFSCSVKHNLVSLNFFDKF